jgi:hypothetical protein
MCFFRASLRWFRLLGKMGVKRTKKAAAAMPSPMVTAPTMWIVVGDGWVEGREDDF